MTVSHLEVLVEEPSAEALLSDLLPRVLGEISFTIHPHQGKQDLLAKLEAKLRAYARWIDATTRILVVVDRDREDCKQLKRKLELAAARAKLASRTVNPRRWRLVNRIAVEEIEAWYFGDWMAVRAAFPRVPASIIHRAEYRESDHIAGGTAEAFERVLQAAGYFRGGLRKIEAARTIAPYMQPSRNRSPSFRALHGALRELSGV